MPFAAKTSTPSNPSNPGVPTLRRGSQGLYVAYCQNLLNARLVGQPALWVDGLFGADTDARVRRFQMMRGLSADGVVGPLTWAALEAGPPPIQRRPIGQPQVSVPATGGV
jgi:peptidoglycan hydrolase-like protein with peptidoglycan-binding domain